MKQFKINEELKNILIQYLATQPFKDVNQLIGGLAQLEEIKMEVKEK